MGRYFDRVARKPDGSGWQFAERRLGHRRGRPLALACGRSCHVDRAGVACAPRFFYIGDRI